MVNSNDINKAIIDGLQVDDEGFKQVKTLDIKELMKLGIVDVAAFLNGLLDAENDKEFSDSAVDYVKGYKYGKTNTF